MIEKITQEELKRVIDYDPHTGAFTWRMSLRRGRAGMSAGCINGRGYLQITVKRVHYQAHHLAWLWATGKHPAGDIDHINRDTKDNRLANLREATRSQNLGNSKRQKNNKSGFKGVRRHTFGRYEANICQGGKKYYLGLYYTPEEAHEAYCAAAKRLFGEFARVE